MENKFNNTYYQPPVQQRYMTPQMQQMAYYEQKRRTEKSEIIKTGVVLGSAIILYIVIQTVLSAVIIGNPMLNRLFDSSPSFQYSVNIICIHFCAMLIPFGLSALILKRNFTEPVFPLKKNPKIKYFAWISVGMGLCLVANYVTNGVIELFKHFGYELTQGDMLKPNNILSCVILVFSTSIVPAVFEEISMRCFAMGALKKYGKGFAVFAVSIIFGLLHLNVIQFVFAFLVGMILGYITIKTESIVPAIIIHGFNNGFSVINDIVEYATTEKTAELTVDIVCIVWAVLAVIGLVYLIIKRDLLPEKTEKKPREPYALSFGTKLACLLPGLALPLLALVGFTMTTINKI